LKYVIILHSYKINKLYLLTNFLFNTDKVVIPLEQSADLNAQPESAEQAGTRSERWIPYGEPYQERLVSMLPGSEIPMAPMAFNNYPQQPPPYMPQAQYYQPPPPPQPAQYANPPVVIPVIANQENQEQKSKVR
jgi:hypothetical protein